MLLLEDVSLKIKEFSIRNISLHIKKGEYFVILGPTGTGKTVLLELIAGFLTPDNGAIHINGREITNVPSEYRGIGMCYQDYFLFPHFTVSRNIDYSLRVQKKNKKEINTTVNALLGSFGIAYLKNRYPDTLSGGEAQRVALARALASDPQLLLLDEPLNALDIVKKEKLQKDLMFINKEKGKTIVHVTHNFEEALSLADRIGVIKDGELIQVGKPDEIFRKPASYFVAQFTGGDNIFEAKLEKHNGVTFYKVGSVTVQVPSRQMKKDCCICIHPEEITLSREKLSSSARNSFKGRVVELTRKGYLVKVGVDIGIVLSAVVTQKSLEEKDIKIGKEIFVTFKASSVHVF